MDAADRYVDDHKDLFTERAETSNTELPENVQAAIDNVVDAFKKDSQKVLDDAHQKAQERVEEIKAEANPTNEHIETSEFTRTDNGEVQPAAKIAYGVDRNAYLAVKKIAKGYGGKWSTYAGRFLFDDANDRNAFAKEAAEYLEEHPAKKYSIA